MILLPTEKPGYFSMIVTGNDVDLRSLVEDHEALRLILGKRVDRTDLVFGAFEAVSYWRLVCFTIHIEGDLRLTLAS